MLIRLFCSLLDVATYGILIWVVLSWIPTTEGHPLRSAKDFLDRILNPLRDPETGQLTRYLLRNFLSPVRMGGVGIDLSPVVLMIGVLLLQRIIC